MARLNVYEQNYRLCLIILLLIACAVLALVCVCWHEDISAAWVQRTLAQSYSGQETALYEKADAIIRANGGYGESALEPVCRGGKAAWIQAQIIPRRSSNERIITLDDDFGRVPAELCSATPAGVEAIVLLMPRSVRVGSYLRQGSSHPHGGRGNFGRFLNGPSLDAFAELLDVHIVDVRGNRYLGCKHFAWQPKGKVDVLSESHIPERHSKEVIDWYTNLPEK